jgi:hypothetical protein
MNKRQLTKLVNELNFIISERNLYSGCQRYYWAVPENGKLMVHNLYDDSLVEYVEGKFRDGYGQTVALF